MWEQIRSNRRKSAILLVLMAVLLLALGSSLGAAATGAPEGAIAGAALAAAVWLILTLVAYAGGDNIMLATAGARRIEKRDLPKLFNIVEEMTIASGLPVMPEVYLIESNVPNAFAVGSPKRSAVAVTTGLLARLNRDELQGVIAHEIGHIRNQDTRFIVLAGVMVAAIVLIADLFWRSMAYGRFRGGRGRGGGQAQAILMLVALVLVILSPILARLLYFACSRKREYLADASAARFTRYPEGLASALEKIDKAVLSERPDVNRVIAPMYIVNPLAARGGISGLFSTHPPTAERIRILRAMGKSASFAQYEEAYRTVSGKSGLIGASALADSGETPVREAAAETEPVAAARKREAMDVLYRKSGYRIAQCTCGTRMKVPPTHPDPAIPCPTCGRSVSVG
ncbi:MAG: M48 family metallopeptidase [Candidatus Sumerlaeia bacterium]|nr:M48 family metallopeptidase [Candidatus Sumerlaeia bacterium]